MGLELVDDGRGLVLSQQPVVDQDARKLAADRPREQRGHHGRIDAAGEAADHPVAADPLPQVCDHALGEILEPPRAGAATGRREEVPEDRAARGRVGDFRVELKTVDRQRVVPDGCQRACGRAGQRPKIGRDLVDLVAVAHPDLGMGRHTGEDRVGLQHLAGGAAVFAGLCPADLAAEGVAGQLHAVADAEHRDAEPEDAGIAPRGAGLVDTRRPTREDDALRVQRLDAVRGHVVADDLAVDMLLANATGDQLGVLRAEVEHQHPFRLL